MNQKTLAGFLNLITLVLLLISNHASLVSAQDEPVLIIDIYDSTDWNRRMDTILFEENNYDVAVSTENESVVLGVNITILDTTYVTSVSEQYVTVTAPKFEESDSIVITATKEGYQTSIIELTILKGELFIITDKTLIKERDDFQVTVKDQNGQSVENALVYVTEEAAPILTDQYGRAFVRAPEIDVFNTATIHVLKSGYLPGSTTIRVEVATGSFFELSESQFLQILPILLAVLVVIISILYVLLRNQRVEKIPSSKKQADMPDELQQPSSEKQHLTKKQARYHETEKSDLTASSSTSRVEEIRIPVQARKKETTYLPDEEESENPSEERKNHQDEWFKGQDYIRYKLDELTGKIDQKTDGKWFEGEHETKYKVDEALKKNLKKKKIDEPPSK